LDIWFWLDPNAYLSIADGFEQVDMVAQEVVRMVRFIQSQWWLRKTKLTGSSAAPHGIKPVVI